MPDLKVTTFHRVAATPEAIDALAEHTEVWRIALDEALVPDNRPPAAPVSGAPVSAGPVSGASVSGSPGEDAPDVSDPYAIVVRDAGWHLLRLDPDNAVAFLRHATDWPIPQDRPVLLQGTAHHVPIKVHLTEDGAAIAVPSPYLAELEARWPRVGAR